MTTVLTATAVVQCGELYHIRLAIADGTDQGLSSYVWLEAGSFKSPVLEVSNDLGLDSNFVEIPCNASITLFADATIKRLISEGYLGRLLVVESRIRGQFIDPDASLHWRQNIDYSGNNIIGA